MPTFKTELPANKQHMGFDLKRTPPTGFLQGIITCDEMIVSDTHFWGGRTIPCDRQQQAPDGSLTAGECKACSEAIPFRTLVYVTVFDPKTRDHYLFECTSPAALPLEEYRKSLGTLRGCILHSSRPKGGKNAKVVIQTNTANLSRVQLPASPNVVALLCTLWRIPIAPAMEHENGTARTRVRADAAKKEKIDTQPNNQPYPEHIGDILNPNGNGRFTISQ